MLGVLEHHICLGRDGGNEFHGDLCCQDGMCLMQSVFPRILCPQVKHRAQCEHCHHTATICQPQKRDHGVHGLSSPKGSTSWAHQEPCHELHREPKTTAPHNPLLPPSRPGQRLTGSTRSLSRGPSLPFHRRGKLKQRELSCSSMPGPAAGSGRALSRRGGRCRLVRGMAPPAHPIITFPPSFSPSLPPKKHFISRHVTVAIANAHALQVSAPTTTRRCLGSAAAAPGLAPTPKNTSDKQLRRSGHGLAAPQIPRGWKLPNQGWLVISHPPAALRVM